MNFKSTVSRLCFGGKEPAAIRWANAHDARLRADERVQARRRAAAKKVAKANRNYFGPVLVVFWAGAMVLASAIPGWPEAQGVLIGGATVISAMAYKKFCTAAD